MGLAVDALVLITVDVKPAVDFAYKATDLMHSPWSAALFVSSYKFNHRMRIIDYLKVFDLQADPAQ
jgi:hypothetical protein